MGGNVHYRDILRCRAGGLNQSQIARACGCSRSAVQDVLRLSEEKGVGWADVAGLSEDAAYKLLR